MIIPLAATSQPGELPLPAALRDATPAVDALNSLLRGEVSAVETFTQAIAKFGPDAPPELHTCLHSHEERVGKLILRIAALGGVAATGSGLWGAFAKLIEGGAALFGRSNALLALAEGEDHGQTVYRAQREHVDEESRRLIDDELLPEQRRTHDQIRSLSQFLA